jgi:hypothetical protein
MIVGVFLLTIMFLVFFVELGLYVMEAITSRIYIWRFYIQRLFSFFIIVLSWTCMFSIFLIATWFILGVVINTTRAAPYATGSVSLS